MKLTVLAITLATIAPCFALPQAVPGLTKRETCKELKFQPNNLCSELIDPCGKSTDVVCENGKCTGCNASGNSCRDCTIFCCT
ncbi:uncharacterized protein L3040_003934 [Drepanopeziza brunnea f. sp. 'multigermtubi']|uniref:uncharacterized protein n=1 Tax=Drepanopeziza brunnea f. sp. 'multigermtubi' TaxID=698441 RepID=UPI00238C07BF|nr:hypothetical protein L3040_003934 [Drepanopeziza brunnea f. sp. 'multigermtubi']